MPPITLWFLQASRSIRTAWLLEELGLDYDVRFSDRTATSRAPEDFRLASGNPLGKFPTIKDENLVVYESGAISDYLCDKYDKEGRLMPKDAKERVRVSQWVHAAEATFALHGLAILYARMNIKNAPEGVLEATEQGMSANVQNDMSWLESELSLSPGEFLVGDHPTAADIMMHFSAMFIIAGELGTNGKEWPNINKWLEACENTESYKRAVKKTGHNMAHRSGPSTQDK